MDQKELVKQTSGVEAPEAPMPTPEGQTRVAGGAPKSGDDAEPAPRSAPAHGQGGVGRPSFLFLGVLSAVVLLAEVGSKAWAEKALSPQLGQRPIILIPDHLTLALAYNEGGAWGLLQSADSSIRKPFFLVVSVIAIAFIVSLYRRLLPTQWALKWGLPLVLGGALGNLSDRIARSGVVDFILYRGDWVGAMNRVIAYLFETWTVTDYWPTFNVADIGICVGVGLMAVDMLTSRREPEKRPASARSEEAREEEPLHSDGEDSSLTGVPK